jgi:hypothetical protein
MAKDPIGTILRRNRERRARSDKARDYYGIAKRGFLQPPIATGTTATGKDGITRTYDAATKTWKIPR